MRHAGVATWNTCYQSHLSVTRGHRAAMPYDGDRAGARYWKAGLAYRRSDAL